MVARNEEKMKNKIQEIKAAHSGIECDYIICDFSKFTTLSEYRENTNQRSENLILQLRLLTLDTLLQANSKTTKMICLLPQ